MKCHFWVERFNIHPRWRRSGLCIVENHRHCPFSVCWQLLHGSNLGKELLIMQEMEDFLLHWYQNWRNWWRISNKIQKIRTIQIVRSDLNLISHRLKALLTIWATFLSRKLMTWTQWRTISKCANMHVSATAVKIFRIVYVKKRSPKSKIYLGELREG